MKKYKNKIFGIVATWNIVVFFIAYFSHFDNFRYKKNDIIGSYKNLLNLDTKLLTVLLVLVLLFSILFILAITYKKADNVKTRVVEDGHYGSAKWADDKVINNEDNYLKKKKITENGAGWYIGEKDDYLIFDKRDRNILTLAPPGGGKTTRILCNNIINAFVNNEVAFTTDTKDELHMLMYPYARKYGYKCINYNYRNPFESNKDNPMSIINKYTDNAMMSDDLNEKAIFKAKAQRHAKILSDSIIDTVPSEAGANAYFYKVAEGIITSIILLIAEHCDNKDRHIVNVLRIVAEGMEAYDDGDIVRTRMYKLMQNLDDSNKIKWFSEAGYKADIRTSMNTFSTALSQLLAFVDDEIEQMICFESDFDVEDLLENNKYFITVNVPEENPTRHFFASLKINTFNNQLLDMASRQEDKVLPFIVREMDDEFGTMPAIRNYANTMTAGRSRGIYIMLIIQNYGQLDLKYGEKEARVIRKACQNVLFTALSPEQYDDAEVLSKALGNQTVIKSTTNKSNSNFRVFNAGQIGEDQIAKPLMFPDDIIRIPFDTWVCLPAGGYPLKLNTTVYTKHLNLGKNIEKFNPEILDYKKVSLITFELLYDRLASINNNVSLHSKDEKNIVTEVETKVDVSNGDTESMLLSILTFSGKQKYYYSKDIDSIKKELLHLHSQGHITDEVFKSCRQEMEKMVAG